MFPVSSNITGLSLWTFKFCQGYVDEIYLVKLSSCKDFQWNFSYFAGKYKTHSSRVLKTMLDKYIAKFKEIYLELYCFARSFCKTVLKLILLFKMFNSANM